MSIITKGFGSAGSSVIVKGFGGGISALIIKMVHAVSGIVKILSLKTYS